MMGNLMSDCQELVYKGFVPVPEDLEELGDNGPLARYSNASKYEIFKIFFVCKLLLHNKIKLRFQVNLNILYFH